MTEQLEREKDLTLEELKKREDEAYKTFLEIEKEKDRILEEIEDIRIKIPDSGTEKSERIVLEKYASQLNEVRERSQQAQEKWLCALNGLYEASKGKDL